jgi:hypothetical protein
MRILSTARRRLPCRCFDPERVGGDKIEEVHRLQEKSDSEEWYGCVLRLMELKEAQPWPRLR